MAAAGTRAVGLSVPRVDAHEKVTGRAAYVADMALPGMLYGEILRSPHPHARIRRIDTGRAAALPGVVKVITGAECPPTRFGAFVQDETGLAIDRVRYVGDGVAAVAAVDEDTATRALELIEVEYEELPFVVDPEEATAEGAPLVHDDCERNIASHNRVVAGDVEQGFAEADLIYEDRFETTKQAHACLEPHVCIGIWEPPGKITLYDSSQSMFFMRFHLAHIFGLPASKIRIIAPYLGGGFGSKSEPHAIHVCAITLSRLSGRPVKMGHTRDEEFTSSRTRHKEIVYLKTGVRRDGTITARQARVILDNGAYTSYGPGVSLTQSMLGAAVYRTPHYRYDGYVAYTNTPMGGAFRGFGSPQFTFAVESQLDMIAERFGISPLEIRRKNLTRPGDVAASGPALTTNGVLECMEEAARQLAFEEKQQVRTPLRGVGLACGTHFTSGKFHPESNADFCAATVKVNEDGSINVLAGVVEMGTGCATTLSQIAAEEFGVDVADVEILLADSETIPADMGTYGSRATTLGGNAVRLACQRAKEQIAAEAARQFGCEPAQIEFRDRRVQAAGDPGRGAPLGQVVAGMMFRDGGGTQVVASAHYDAPCALPDPETGIGDFAMSYSFGCHAVEVEVDPETGKVKILNFVAASDCGNVINPVGAEGQVQGGAVQGIGYALLEGLKCPDGQPINTRFGTYKIPTVMEVPPIRSIWVETDDPRGPWGAKGLGEMGLVPTAPAIANAVADAIGVRIQELPLSPDKIVAALRERAAAQPKAS